MSTVIVDLFGFHFAHLSTTQPIGSFALSIAFLTSAVLPHLKEFSEAINEVHKDNNLLDGMRQET